ncbi:MAG: hypothetical protein KC656_02480 [Myxococcales bacterium]|nr:hypothetical protein [Myxococcales bacterium]
MCDVSEGFKLCTCAPDGPVDWTLWRAAPIDGMFSPARGMVLPRTEDEEIQALFLLDGLERGDVFDFPYVPEPDDRITFHGFGRADMTFRHDGRRWELLDPQIDPAPAGVRHRQGRMGLGELAVAGAMWDELLADPTPERRAVVADWLHERGHGAVATWLLLDGRRQAGEPVDGVALRHAAERVGLSVRALLGDGPVACGKKCPARWVDLDATEDPRRRRCRCGRTWTFVDFRTAVYQVVDGAMEPAR